MSTEIEKAELIRAYNEVLLKPVRDYLANPHPGSARENALNGGVRLVDRDKNKDMVTALMQAVESGHVFHAGHLTLNKEQTIYHQPALNGAAALVANIVSLELKGYTLNDSDSRTKMLLIEQPVPGDNDVAPRETPSLEPYFLKPPVEELLKKGETVPEIDDLLAGKITMLRPISLSNAFKLPAKLTEVVRLGQISVTGILVQNYIDVFSTPARKNEAIELLGIANRRTGHNADQGAQRIAEIMGMDYTP